MTYTAASQQGVITMGSSQVVHLLYSLWYVVNTRFRDFNILFSEIYIQSILYTFICL